jgi:hypothetical protein
LRNLKGVKWVIKVDIIKAFYKIRIAEGEEHKIAVQTYYGAFEWLVTSFGNSGVPATFQWYINFVLREFLDNFALAYINDIIIYIIGLRRVYL